MQERDACFEVGQGRHQFCGPLRLIPCGIGALSDLEGQEFFGGIRDGWPHTSGLGGVRVVASDAVGKIEEFPLFGTARLVGLGCCGLLRGLSGWR